MFIVKYIFFLSFFLGSKKYDPNNSQWKTGKGCSQKSLHGTYHLILNSLYPPQCCEICFSVMLLNENAMCNTFKANKLLGKEVMIQVDPL